MADDYTAAHILPEDYVAFRELSSMPGDLAMPYEGWFLTAEADRAARRSRGGNVVCLTIHPDEFKTWCEAHGRPAGPESRVAFAEWKRLSPAHAD